MNGKRMSQDISAETVPQSQPTRYELIDRRGRVFGPYPSMTAALRDAEWKWPDLEQDFEEDGEGWDVRVEGCR